MNWTRWVTTSALLLMTTTAASADSKAKLLVQDLTAQGVEPHEALVLSTATCNAFAKATKYDVLCGEDLRNMMKFGVLAASFDGCANDECYTNVGRAIQARFVVAGSVSKLGKIYVLSLSMLDTQTGRPVGRTEVKADSLESLHTQVDEAYSAVITGR
jgi:TolB-like protein